MDKHIEQYLELRDRVDEQCEALHKLHQDKMKCNKGCDQCCMSFDIFPVEFFAIKQQLENATMALPNKQPLNGEDCLFLQEGACSIYEARPIICRTHGLPFLYVGEEENWELSHCPLNFEEQEPEFFHTENTFAQDRCNSELFMINKAFLEANPQLEYKEFDLLPTSQLR